MTGDHHGTNFYFRNAFPHPLNKLAFYTSVVVESPAFESDSSHFFFFYFKSPRTRLRPCRLSAVTLFLNVTCVLWSGRRLERRRRVDRRERKRWPENLSGPRASPEIRRRAEAVFREPRRRPLVCSEFTRDLAVDRGKRYRICHRRSIIK